MNIIKKLWGSRAVRYCFFGLMTTLVNVVSYFLLTLTPLGATIPGQTVANTASVTLSIIFAFIVNSRYVFYSSATKLSQHLSEFVRFFGARLTTLFIEVGGVAVMSLCGLDDMAAKLVTQVIVFVLNYIFSRFLVFKRGGEPRE